MLNQYLQEYPAEYLATYTRNPSVLKMMLRSTRQLYPLVDDDELKHIALDMPHASLGQDGIVYHFNRYDENGLFQSGDPAERSVTPASGKSLKQLFVGLQDERNALIVSAKIQKGMS